MKLVSANQRTLTLAALASGLLVAPRPGSADLYVLRMSPTTGISYAIASNGLTAGYTIAGQAFTFNGNNFVNYGSGPLGSDFFGLGVNASGHVVGYGYDNSDNINAIYAFSPSSQFVSYSPLGGTESLFNDVSDRLNSSGYGDLCGWGTDLSGNIHAIGYDSMSFNYTGLAEPAGTVESDAIQVSNTGAIVGYYYGVDTPNGLNGFYWNQDTGEVLPIGTLPEGTYSSLYGVSEDGTIACGAADSGGVRHALVWNGLKLFSLTLSTPSSTNTDAAFGVRATDARTVGVGSNASGTGTAATVWPLNYSNVPVEDLNTITVAPNGSPISLNLVSANNINEAGQIVCTAEDSSNYYPVRLDPVGPATMTVPATVGKTFKGSFTLNMPAPADVYVSFGTSDPRVTFKKNQILVKKGKMSGTFKAKVAAGAHGKTIGIYAYDSGLFAFGQVVTK